MGQDARNAILIRLKAALLAKGAADAAKRLDIVRSLLATQDDAAIRSLARRHCREYALNPAWILEGRERETALLPDAATTWAPVFAMAATHPGTGRWQLREIERIALAPFMLGPSRFVIRMDSAALEPRIRRGAYLVVDTAEDAGAARNDAAERGVSEPTAPFAMDIRGKGLVVCMLPDGQGELAALRQKEVEGVLSGEAVPTRIVGRVVWVAQSL